MDRCGAFAVGLFSAAQTPGTQFATFHRCIATLGPPAWRIGLMKSWPVKKGGWHEPKGATVAEGAAR